MKQIADKYTKAKTLVAKSSIQINNTVDEKESSTETRKIKK
jgi:hypothetical protein